MMNRVLILFAHPRYEKSKTNRALIAGIHNMEGVTFHDLYEQYPDFNIDVEREQKLLSGHDVLVWHFPFYMYSAPALLKQWMDTVLEYGWSYGLWGNALKGKIVFIVLTSGGTRESYAANKINRHSLNEFLTPFEQTARLCKMTYLPPFAVHGTHLLTPEHLTDYAAQYRLLLTRMMHGMSSSLKETTSFEYLNDWLTVKEG